MKFKNAIARLLIIVLLTVAIPISTTNVKASTDKIIVMGDTTYKVSDYINEQGERQLILYGSDNSKMVLKLSDTYISCKNTYSDGTLTNKVVYLDDYSTAISNDELSCTSSKVMAKAKASTSLTYAPKVYEKYKNKFYYQLGKNSDCTKQYYKIGNGSTSSLINITKNVPSALSDYRSAISKVNSNYTAIEVSAGIGTVATIVGIVVACVSTDGAAAAVLAVLGCDVAAALAIVGFATNLVDAYDSLALLYINAANCGTKQ